MDHARLQNSDISSFSAGLRRWTRRVVGGAALVTLLLGGAAGLTACGDDNDFTPVPGTEFPGPANVSPQPGPDIVDPGPDTQIDTETPADSEEALGG